MCSVFTRNVKKAFTKIDLHLRVYCLPLCLAQLILRDVLQSSAPLLFQIFYNHHLWAILAFFLELILGNKHGDFGDVPPQLDSSLQLTHLHFSLQRGRALHRAHQHQLTRQAVWTLDCEVAASLLSPQQGEAKRVTYWTQSWDSEHDARSWQVGHNSQVVVGEGVWGLSARLVVHRAGVTFTTPGK